MLARASFRSFKNLREVDVDLDQLTVLVGPNGAGKTSVMQGIHLLTQLGRPWKKQDNPFAVVFSGRYAPSRLVTSGDEHFQITLLEAPASPGEPIEIASLRASRDEGPQDETFILEMPESIFPRVVASMEGLQMGLFDPQPLRHLASTVFLQLDAAIMARPSVVEDAEPQLKGDGRGLASVLAYIAGAHPDRKEAIEADMATIVPWFRRVLVKPEKVSRLATRPFAVGREAVNVPVEEEVWGHRFLVQSRDGAVVPADLLSEGTVLVLGLMTVLHGPTPPRLLLVDDLDRGLHLGAQTRLVRSLQALLAQRPDLQIIASTHSPFLLQEVPATSVRVMGLTPEGVRCRKLVDHPDYEKWKAVLGTGEIWANLGEEWVGVG
jgi:predicted ATPase